MSVLNRYATMPIKYYFGDGFHRKLLKDTVLKDYAMSSLFRKSFNKINGEYQQSYSSKRHERVHGDSKSKFGGNYCMSIGLEKEPDAEGGAYRRVIGLYVGDTPLKDRLIVKAEFGGPITAPRSDVLTGFMFRTALLLMLKEAAFKVVDGIDVNELSEDPEATEEK